MIDLTIDTRKVRGFITDFIRTETSQAGYTRGVINLSGGIDSALACSLAVEALGAENVLALRLPYHSSSPDSLAHAQLVIDTLGIASITLPITSMVEPLFERFPEMSPVRRGNVMARQRMIVLYDQSEAFHGLPIGTGNKTEILLGYSTIYGDAACAINPLGDLYKTQVRQLARALGVPEPILDKPPSADLWDGQTDEGELGFTYAEVDQLLALLVERRASLAECRAAGFDADFITTVINRIRRTRYKRMLPPVAILSKHAL
jgi:NAD+ synthase